MIDREFLASLTFRVMDKDDKMGFAGVQSPVPLIAENEYCLVIIDGDRCEVYGDDFASDFGPEFVCESISELPY
jgi:hypothetical protein